MKSFIKTFQDWIKANTPLFSGVLVILGISLAVFAVTGIIRSVTLEESPFDLLDAEEEGFLPSVNLSAGDEPAPALPVRDQSFAELTSTAEALLDAEEDLTEEPSQSEPQVSPTPEPPRVPERIVIPDIELDAPVVEASTREVEYLEEFYEQWLAPNEFAVGWHATSAMLGEPGNTVLNGHHNVYGEVFKRLEELEIGDFIWVHSGDRAYVYQVATRLILKERWQPVEVRLDNARWLQSSQDERLTLVTCWPYDSNTHRLIIAARPVRSYTVEGPELEHWISPDQEP